MVHTDHVFLLQKAAIKPNSVWAEFGSGDGAFTLALRDLGGQTIEIYSIDRDESRLATQQVNFERQFPSSRVHFVHADFTTELALPLLDGLLMANSLHYVEDKVSFLVDWKKYLKSTGVLVVVEYNTNRENPWIPFPVSYETFQKLADEAGYAQIQKLEVVPLEWGNQMYSAGAQVS